MNSAQGLETRREAVIGCLLGTAVGDAVGLVCEGLPRRRQARLYPDLDGPRLLGRRGMVSDDTEHACLVAQALIQSAGEPEAFRCCLARRLRGWLLALPAGVGWATLRACLKLSAGVPPDKSGVASAGNGPAMRSALLGVCFGDEPERLRALVRASTRITHTDERAEVGALAVAVAAHLSCQGGSEGDLTERYRRALQAALDASADDFLALVQRAGESAGRGESTATFAAAIGAGEMVTGYVYQTVPVALHAWFRHPHDLRSAVLNVVHCGGDTDTTAAIVGAIVGAGVGREGVPQDWLNALWEWPRTVGWLERLGGQLAQVCAAKQAERALGLPFLPLAGRNVVFAVVVIAHGLRRLLPPY